MAEWWTASRAAGAALTLPEAFRLGATIWIIGTIAHIHVVRATVDRGEVRQDDGLRVRIQKTANGRLTYIAGSCIAV